jgi:hypothetical protein
MKKETEAASTDIVEQEDMDLVEINEDPKGFEDDDSEDMIIPRVKVIQTLSPERKDKIAEEGDILNSLTKDKLNGLNFIPVFKFNNHVLWKDRTDGGGIQCIARDAKVGEKSDGTTLLCVECKACEFDNTKQGKEATPKCTKYINFFGFIEGQKLPIILSFAKTNYNEGKKLYSLAKVTMQNMWNFKYQLTAKLIAKNANEWYIILTAPMGKTSTEDRSYGLSLYKSFRGNQQKLAYDMEDASTTVSEPDVHGTEY